MAQTTYTLTHRNAIAGMLADSGPRRCDTRISAEASAGIPTGVAVKRGATDRAALLIAASTDAVDGIAVYSDNLAGTLDIDTTGILPGTEFSILKQGRIYVKAEEAVTRGDQAFVRFATSVNTPSLTQKGAFRKSPDGVAQVTTLTPTATNSLVSELRIDFTTGPAAGKTFAFEFQADGSATAAEWVTGMKAAMAKDAVFSALITPSGTTTLILTGATAGLTFEVADVGDQANAIVATTPAAPTARALAGAYFAESAIATGIVPLDFDFNRP